MPSLSSLIKRWTLLLLATAAGYILAHRQAVAWRGYEAYGGELAIWLLPVMAWVLRRIAVDWWDEIKRTFEEEKKGAA